jgi:protein-arginine kinase activator protein McsA
MEKSIVEMVGELSFDELIRSYDVDLLDKCRKIYEITEEFEKCAKIRDRIKLIKNANNNRLFQ